MIVVGYEPLWYSFISKNNFSCMQTIITIHIISNSTAVSTAEVVSSSAVCGQHARSIIKL